MAVFDRFSRYAKPPLKAYTVRDFRGREVHALPTPAAPVQISIGAHVLKEGQRLDHLAAGYLDDANGFWRIADLNDAMTPDAVAERETLEIPSPVK